MAHQATEAKGRLLEGSIALRTKALAGGRKSLYIDYTVGGRHHRTALALYLVPEESVRARRANRKTLRQAQAILRRRQEELLHEQLRRERARSEQGTLLSAWLAEQCEAQRRRGVRSLTRLHTVRARLLEYAPAAILEQLDKPFLSGFIDYLRTEYRTRSGQPLAPKTLFNMIGIFSAALNRAVSEGRLAQNPYRLFEQAERLRPGRDPQREYLTIEELKQLIATPCASAEVQRIFLFSCFTGLRISDVQRLRWSDLSEHEGGLRIGIRQEKTHRTLYIPLSKQARKWMPDRGDQPAEAPLFAVVPHDYNARIAAWVQAAGIAKHITHHCGRHTYATMLLTLGVDLYTVSKLLGHTSLRHTQRYAQIVDRQKDEAVHLADRVFGPAAET